MPPRTSPLGSSLSLLELGLSRFLHDRQAQLAEGSAITVLQREPLMWQELSVVLVHLAAVPQVAFPAVDDGGFGVAGER